jgi:NAD(P)-dependent dehydrogenase (short-subunit alcohol dehydrogenase family)
LADKNQSAFDVRFFNMETHISSASVRKKKPGTMSRRKMLATSTGALLGASAVARAMSSAENADVGDKTPHVSFNLQGKSALVTGAARGIGRAICAALAAAGSDVMGLDICAMAAPNLVYPPATPEELDETGKLVEQQKRHWTGIKADIRDLAALRNAVDRAIKEFGKLDIAVANAAIQIYGPLAEISDENWKNVIDVNLTGTANTLRAVLPHMLERQFGRIVIIASGQGRHGFREGSAYSASKWGVIGLMKSAAWEVAKNGVTINCVEPGLVDTPMTRNPGRWKEALKEAGKQPKDNPTEQEVIAARLPQSVMGIPWMQPDEVAPAVVFLCTDAANRVTGATYDATAGDSVKYTA